MSRDELYRHAFQKHLEGFEHSIQRLYEGIDFLEENEHAMMAFRCANAAILRSQTDETLHDGFRRTAFQWRPFQFAFQLLNLRGLAQVDFADRNIADLAWFPTGGGKPKPISD